MSFKWKSLAPFLRLMGWSLGMRKGHRSQETGIETGKTKSALSGDKSQKRKAVFLPGRSCTDQVLTLTLIIKATSNEQKKTHHTIYGFQVGIWETSSWLIWEQCEPLWQASQNNYHHKGFISRLSLCKVYASSREWFTQIAMSRKMVLGRAGDLLWDKGEDGATGSAMDARYTFTCDKVSTQKPARHFKKRICCPLWKETSKCNESLNSSLLPKAIAYKNRGSLYIWQENDGRQSYQKLARSIVLAGMGFGHAELKEHMMKSLRWNVIFHLNKQM